MIIALCIILLCGNMAHSKRDRAQGCSLESSLIKRCRVAEVHHFLPSDHRRHLPEALVPRPNGQFSKCAQFFRYSDGTERRSEWPPADRPSPRKHPLAGTAFAHGREVDGPRMRPWDQVLHKISS